MCVCVCGHMGWDGVCVYECARAHGVCCECVSVCVCVC